MITKSQALETLHCDRKGKANPTSQSFHCVSLPFTKSIDVLNMSGRLRVNDSECNEKERALLFALTHPSV